MSKVQNKPMDKQNKLWVGNIPFKYSDTDIQAFFEEAGFEVAEVKLITDFETGHSRGYAFVELVDPADLQRAITGLDGSDIGGRNVVVKKAIPQRPRQTENKNHNRRDRK